MPYQGAIFDVDGVLVDSPHELAWGEARGWSRFPNRGCDIDCFHGRAATVVLNALTGVQLFDDLPKPGVG
jgi:hypothetical protein